jgi:hypothetical protein
MSDSDPEIAALTTLLKTLEPLKDEQRIRVLGFVFQRLNIRMPGSSAVQQDQSSESGSDLSAALGTAIERKPPPDNGRDGNDIRSLKEAKKPRTASEMAALVAYYLEHVAEGDERREYITPDDVRPYFNQAGFPLPTAPPNMTLTNAKNAGYLTARERGQYRLNPVGYNLIAYKLPVDGSQTGTKTARRAGKKGVAKKKAGKRR